MKYFSSQNIFQRKKIMFENLNISENNIIIVKATKELQQSLVSISQIINWRRLWENGSAIKTWKFLGKVETV
jgi:hypothetical protein